MDTTTIISGLFVTIVGGVIVAILTKKITINFRTRTITIKSNQYVSPYSSGSFVFDYSNNNGAYVIGQGDRSFTTKWSKASNAAIHAYSDAQDIDSVGLLKHIDNINDIREIDADFSSRCRCPRIGDAIVWRNGNGFYAITKIINIKDGTRGDSVDELECQYVIMK